MANVARRWAERFQGKKGPTSSGAFPPAAAQLSKYQVSHNRGLSSQHASVANSENMAAASRPLHRETFSMDVVNVSDAAQPLQGPRRQREELFLDGQVRIVAPIVGRMTRLLAALFRDRLVPLGIEQIVGTVATGSLLRLAAKEFVLQDADLAAELIKFFLQLFDAFDGIGVSALPIAHLPTESGPQLLQARSKR
jgi:hypothetical protein